MPSATSSPSSPRTPKHRAHPLSRTFCFALLLFSGCGREAPTSNGSADMNLLGTGLAAEISNALPDGGTVLVFGTPGALGYGQQLEQSTIQSLKKHLKSSGITIQPAEYTEEEISLFQGRQHTTLHPDVATGPLQRQAAAPQAIVSFLDPPRQEGLLPRDTLFIGVTWNHQSPRTLPPRHILIRSRSGPRDDTPMNTPEQALDAFHRRFDVTRSYE